MRNLLAILYLITFFYGFTLLGWPSKAWARFYHPDAAEIDREESLSSEYYNDVLSYRFSPLWLSLWEEKRRGYRVSAGSLSVVRFYLLEEIKLQAEGEERWALAFEQKRYESMEEQRFTQELRLSFPLFVSPLYGVLLADGKAF